MNRQDKKEIEAFLKDQKLRSLIEFEFGSPLEIKIDWKNDRVEFITPKKIMIHSILDIVDVICSLKN